MRIKILCSLFLLVGVLINTVHAHPPNSIDLSYSIEDSILHIEMRHTTHDPREDYIRKIEVVVNSNEPVVKRYNIQPNALKFSDDITVAAEEGDTIIIKAFSKEGGTGTASIIVEVEEEEEDGKKKSEEKKKVKQPKGSGY